MDWRSSQDLADAVTRGTGNSPLAQRAMLRACQAVLRPVARLAVGRGLLFGDVAEVLKQCFVEAARAAHPGVVPNRAVSRISATTGVNRGDNAGSSAAP